MVATGEQVWDYEAIDAGAETLRTINKRITSIGEALHGSLVKLAGLWGGTSSSQWQLMQNKLHEKIRAVNDSLASLANAITEANAHMRRTDKSVEGRFM